MKKIFLFFIFCLALPCAAQKRLGDVFWCDGFIGNVSSRQAGKLLKVTEVTPAQLGRMFSGDEIRILPKTPDQTAVNKYYHNLEKYIFNQTSPFNEQKIVSLLFSPSSRQQEQFSKLYKEVMHKFFNFKQEMDVWLYYQSKPSERHIVSAAEQEELANKITDMNAELGRLRNYVSPTDPAYKAALEYMLHLIQTVNPMLRGVLKEKNFIRSDREYKYREFFLYTPVPLRTSSLLTESGDSQQTIPEFPRDFKIAVLNDEYTVLSKMKSLHKTIFFPNSQLRTYEDAEDLLRDIHSGVRYDVILTDIIVPGGGGLYLTATLREENFPGAIIALSAYEEDLDFGKNLFDRGFDGMIEVNIGFEHGKDWPFNIMKQIRNYYYYKNLHGWSR